MENNLICSRCRSPRKVAKTWIEMIETRAGKSKLTHTQIVCSNKECQKEFERKLAEEIRRKEEMKMKNESYAAKKRAALLNPEAGEKKITLR